MADMVERHTWPAFFCVANRRRYLHWRHDQYGAAQRRSLSPDLWPVSVNGGTISSSEEENGPILASMVADLPCAVCGKQSAHVELVAPGDRAEGGAEH